MANTSPDNISYPTNADAQKTIEQRIQDTANSVQTSLNTKASLSGSSFTGDVATTGKIVGTTPVEAGSTGGVAVKAPSSGSQTSAYLQFVNNAYSLQYGAISADPAGVITISTPVKIPNQPAFSAYASAATLDATRTMPYNVAVVNVGGYYNTSTYRFTAPVAGTYLFSIYDIGFAGYTTRFDLLKNGSSLEDQGKAHQLRANNTSDYATATSFWIVQAAQNDYFEVRIYAGRSHGTVEYSWFQGHLIG